MTQYLLTFGSNCPDAPAMMQRAQQWLRTNFTSVDDSGIYSTKALNGVAPDYLNMVARADSALGVTELTALCKDFEVICGRSPRSKLCGCVEMDVDIIQADNVILRPVEFTRSYFLEGLSLLQARGKLACGTARSVNIGG